MFDQLLSLGGKTVSSLFGGKGTSGGGSNQASAAEVASLAKIGFANERQVAMQASRDAINLTNKRVRNPQEGSAKDAKYKQQMAQLIKGIQDTRVREAIIQQALTEHAKPNNRHRSGQGHSRPCGRAASIGSRPSHLDVHEHRARRV